ncbi:translation initiation factor IF-2 [Patescibacteria group bacterium]
MKKNKKKQQKPIVRPPVVTVLGHVDHGKTSLLDYIRKTSITSKEHGGITQHIGAYQINAKYKTSKGITEDKIITFIDTPGHEAFSQMRSRGAHVADIVILVVAADDSVKPQTKESIQVIKDAKIPFIVAMNKVDLPSANPNKIKQDLAREEVQVAGFGGDVPFVPISATDGTGVEELLSTIASLSTSISLESKSDADLELIVIETQVDKGKGSVATVIVQSGMLKRGVTLFENSEEIGRVRAMFDEFNTSVQEAYPGKPVEVLGFKTLPTIGSIIRDHSVQEKKLVEIIEEEETEELPDFLKPIQEQEKKKLLIVLKADTAGSLEAVREALGDQVLIVNSGVGDITEKDVQVAKSSTAFIVGFNVTCNSTVKRLAEYEKVIYRTYNIIYKLLEELQEVIEGMEEVLTKEREIGKGTIIAEFPFNNQRVAGTKIVSGRLARGDMIKILRDGEEIQKTKIKSIRQGKSDVSKVEGNIECGVLFDTEVDFLQDDDIIAFIKS